MVALSTWAFIRLQKLRASINEAVQNDPAKYPGYGGRYLGMSDIINLLYERVHNELCGHSS